MTVFAGIASLVGLSLFLARVLRRSSALMPLVAVSAAMLWFTLAGVFGLLLPAGYIWYGLCAVALGYTIVREKSAIRCLFSPGLVVFALGSALLALLFLFTRPMLTQWDEFTFWGTAGKVVSQTNQLYTTATSSLIARSYPPGLIMVSYVLQFFGGFTEAGFITSFGVLQLACLVPVGALWGKNRSASVICLLAMLCLPFLFAAPIPGQMSYSYLSCMADVPMGLLFGGALCFYFAGGVRDTRLLLPFGLVLAALACVKEMALAFALIALFVAMVDLLFCERDRLSFFRLRRWKGLAAACGACLLLVVGAFLLWAWHLQTARGINRFDFGNQQASLPAITMLLQGVSMLFGINRSEQFSLVLDKMLRALVTEPVLYFGSGLVAFCLIAAVLALAWFFAATKRRRRRVLVFALGMALCFVAFYIFNIFTYAFVFQYSEASILKDYHRYISPYWVAWLMGALVLLCDAAVNEQAAYTRLRAARLTASVVMLVLLCGGVLAVNREANFMRISPALYGERELLAQTSKEAREQGLAAGDQVYILSQGDDGTRFYIYGFELEAVRIPVYNGYQTDEAGKPLLDVDGNKIYYGNAANTLVAPGNEDGYGITLPMACLPEDFVGYLRQSGATHVLLDRLDDYIVEAFAPLFSDRLAGWLAGGDPVAAGHRYYRVEWQDDGNCILVAQDKGVAA